MSRGKKHQKAKQKAKRIMKAKKGKPVPINLQNLTKKYAGLQNRFCYKTNIHRLIYKDGKFSNVKYQASNITNCNYKNTKLDGIDFVGCNLKGTNFAGATLRNVLFMCCNLKGVNFTNCKFHNVYFVTTNIGECIGLPEKGCVQMHSYPRIEVDESIKTAVDRMCKIKSVNKMHILNVKNKLNMWNIKILFDRYGNKTGELLLQLSRERNLRNLCSLGSYCDFIENHYEVC